MDTDVSDAMENIQLDRNSNNEPNNETDKQQKDQENVEQNIQDKLINNNEDKLINETSSADPINLFGRSIFGNNEKTMSQNEQSQKTISPGSFHQTHMFSTFNAYRSNNNGVNRHNNNTRYYQRGGQGVAYGTRVNNTSSRFTPNNSRGRYSANRHGENNSKANYTRGGYNNMKYRKESNGFVQNNKNKKFNSQQHQNPYKKKRAGVHQAERDLIYWRNQAKTQNSNKIYIASVTNCSFH